MFAASKSGSVVVKDSQFNYVTMLLHGDGTNGAQNNIFLDSSSNAFSITRNGNTTQGSFSPYGSNWSNYFDGASYFTIPDNAAWNMGSGNFTAEAWIYPTSYSNESMIMGQWSGDLGGTGLNWALMFSSGGTGYLRLITSSNGSGVLFDLSTSSTSFALPLNTWQHVAAVRSGSTFTLYVNGVSRATTTNASALYDATNVFTIGCESNTPSQYFNGYISNTRVVKGTAVYTASFTPSTTPLTAISGTVLLSCQSNRFIDNSSNAFTLTTVSSPSVQRFNPFGASTAYSTSVIGGSGYFDGSGDYLTAPNNIANQLGASDFTIQFWAYFTAVSGGGVATLLAKRSSGAAISDFVFATVSGAMGFYASSGTGSWDLSTGGNMGSPVTGQWYHYVAVRSGSNVSVYVNGARTGNGSFGTTSLTNSTNAVSVGGDQGSNYFTGYIEDVQIVKGTAIYNPANTTITIPSAPLTNVTNTSLLLNMTNGAIYDNAMMNDLETVGNAQISTSVKKYGTGSLAFDGIGDYLKQLKTPNVTFGTGAFTFEFWFRTSASTQYMSFFSNESGGGGFTILINSSAGNGVIQIYNGGSGLIHASSAGGWNDGNWHFLVLDRDSSGSRLFIDGTQQGSTNAGQASAVFDAGDLIIGNNLAYSGRDYNGYIDDLRITKGYARYTTNFTPPIAAFSNIGPN